MASFKSGLVNVYLELGRILDQPQSFGLGERAPDALVKVLTRLRQSVKDEMTNENGTSGDYLADELSQDADKCA